MQRIPNIIPDISNNNVNRHKSYMYNIRVEVVCSPHNESMISSDKYTSYTNQ